MVAQLRGTYHVSRVTRPAYTGVIPVHHAPARPREPMTLSTRPRTHYFLIREIGAPHKPGVLLREEGVLVSVEYLPEEDAWGAKDVVSLEFGIGETPEDAVSDFKGKLYAMATWFIRNERPLGRHMRQRFEAFRTLFPGL